MNFGVKNQPWYQLKAIDNGTIFYSDNMYVVGQNEIPLSCNSNYS